LLELKGIKSMDAGLTAIGAGIAIGLAAIGTGLAQSRIGAAGVGAVAEKPDLIGLVILLIAIPETMVILGFAAAAMILLLGGGNG
jgi:V/A-type H+-transporting ATPase subunit K